jgi:nucleoside-diphosphate-sugar epimerase
MLAELRFFPNVKKVAVSGANGFLGRALVARFNLAGRSVVPFVRNPNLMRSPLGGGDVTSLLEPKERKAWMKQCSEFVHCAARTHIMSRSSKDSLTEFRKINVDLTLELAREAASSGVKRFVFVSSIGVNGPVSGNRPFAPEDPPKPHTPYAQSKHEAEQGLRKIACETCMEVVIVRPPLIYGIDAPGRFGALFRHVQRGWPLPLGAVTDNRRSLVAIDNLVDLLTTCLDHPAAANETFLVSDGEDISTADLISLMGSAMGKPTRLWPVPTAWLRLAAYATGNAILVRSLLDNLQVDLTKTCRLLSWEPPISVYEGLRRCVARVENETSC